MTIICRIRWAIVEVSAITKKSVDTKTFYHLKVKNGIVLTATQDIIVNIYPMANTLKCFYYLIQSDRLMIVLYV